MLIVADGARRQAAIRDALGSRYRTRAVNDGAEGIAQAAALDPALVVSDVGLPGVDGFTLLGAIKSDSELCHIRVVLIASRAEARERLVRLWDHADAYVPPPGALDVLPARVARLLSASAPDPCPEAPVQPADGGEAEFIRRARRLVAEQATEPGFGVQALAAALGTGPRQLRRRLAALTGETPSAFIRRTRVERAASLLDEGDWSVKEVAHATGFESTSGFRTAFRDAHGIAPSAYVERHAA